MYRILLLTPELPYPPEQGASLRNFFILKGLSRHHEVDLISFGNVDEDATLADDSPLHILCSSIRLLPAVSRSQTRRLKQLLTSSAPDITYRFSTLAFANALGGLLDDGSETVSHSRTYDIAQIEGLELGHTIPTLRRLSPATTIVYDAHNAETELQRRAFYTDLSDPLRWPAALYSFLQVRRLRDFETWACKSADWVTGVSATDVAILEKLYPVQQYSVIPNCIDVETFDEESEHEPVEFDLIFVGKMDYRPNVDAVIWFARKIWPSILDSRPGTTWGIVGQKPHSRLSWLKSSPGVTVTGYVDRVDRYLSGAKVVVLPLRMGSGTRLKLLEAMAAKKAVVSTSQGAEGIPELSNRAVLIEDDPHHFAVAVLRLLDHREERKQLGLKARVVAEGYDWRRVVPKFDRLYRKLRRSTN